MDRRIAALLACVFAAFGAQTATAFAIDYYVDSGEGEVGNTCLQEDDGPAPLGPCETINQAMTLAQANAGVDEVRVADGDYDESVAVSDGTVLRALETGVPDPVINNVSTPALTAVTIVASGGSVDGFDITSSHRPLAVNGPGSVTDNYIATTTAPATAQHVSVSGVTGNVLIADNELSDDGISAQTGIIASSTAATNLTIRDNTFDGLQTAIWLQAGDASPLIADNDIEGLHDSGFGVLTYQGTPVITGNSIDSAVGVLTTGISIDNVNGGAGATLSRNKIIGLNIGVVVSRSAPNPQLPVSLNGDLVAGSGFIGLYAFDGDPGGADIAVTGATLFDNDDADILLDDVDLTLDSSILDDLATGGSNATCAISFSRGFGVGGPPADDCDDFQTAANPMFVSPGSPDFDYHLQAGSPMIDAGNPLAPGAGVLDFDGDLRAISPAPTCPGRRDIGADEFVPASPGPAVCPSQADPPAPAPAKKKCKKGRKLKKGKCVKKRRKKH